MGTTLPIIDREGAGAAVASTVWGVAAGAAVKRVTTLATNEGEQTMTDQRSFWPWVGNPQHTKPILPEVRRPRRKVAASEGSTRQTPEPAPDSRQRMLEALHGSQRAYKAFNGLG